MNVLSHRTRAAAAEFATVQDFFLASVDSVRAAGAGACNFTFGNPHEMPLAGFVAALDRSLTPQSPN